MAVWTLGNNQLVQVQVQSLRSMPGLVCAFPTSSAFLKSKSKLFIALRRIIQVPARKYVASISPLSGKYDQPYLELPIIAALHQLIKGYTLDKECIILGEIDLQGALQPLPEASLWLVLAALPGTQRDWQLIIPEGTNVPISPTVPTYTARTVAEALHIVEYGQGKLLAPPAQPSTATLPSQAELFLAQHAFPLLIALSANVPLLITSAYANSFTWLAEAIAYLIPTLATGRLIPILAHQHESTQLGIKQYSSRPVWIPQPPHKLNQLYKVWPYLGHGIIVITTPQRYSSQWWQELWGLYEQTDLPVRPQVIITQLPCDCGNKGTKRTCYCTSAQRTAWDRWYNTTVRQHIGVKLTVSEWPSEPTDYSITKLKRTMLRITKHLNTLEPLDILPHTDVLNPRLDYTQQQMLQRMVLAVQHYYKSSETQPEHWLQALELMGLSTI